MLARSPAAAPATEAKIRAAGDGAAIAAARARLEVPAPCQPEPLPRPPNRTAFTAAKLEWVDQMLTDHLLPAESRLIGAYLAQRANYDYGGAAWPSLACIGFALGSTERTVRKYMKPLQERGWIIVKRRQSGSSVYTLATDPRVLVQMAAVQAELSERLAAKRDRPQRPKKKARG